MPRRQRSQFGEWVSNQLWNTSVVWLIPIAFLAYGFYLLTNTRLDLVEKAQTDMKVALVEGRKQDSVERDKSRDTFLAYSRDSAAGISELNKQTAILSATMASVQKELEKISARLDQQAIVPRTR